MSDHDHPENASIREVQAVKDELLKAIGDMERRLTARIDKGFREHDEEHAEGRRSLDARLATIDRFIDSNETATARAAGRSDAIGWIIRGLRIVNDFRWLIVAAAGIFLAATGGIHIEVR